MREGTSLSLKSAEFRYPHTEKPVFSALDLEIRAGEWIAIVGPNGSGKSTMLKLFNALLLPTQGVCLVDGRDTREKGEEEYIRSSVSLVFQNPDDQIVASVVEEDTAFGPENLGLDPETIRRRVKDALTTAGLWEKRKFPVADLSGGQKQKLALAGVLAVEPGCFLLDEALAMLDPAGRREFMDLIRARHREGATVVQVTHRLDEIISADRVFVFSGGTIEWQGTAGEFLSLPGERLSEMGFIKPACAVLKDELVEAGIIPASVDAGAEAIYGELCRLKLKN